MFTKFASYKVPPVMVSTHGSVVPLAMFKFRNTLKNILEYISSVFVLIFAVLQLFVARNAPCCAGLVVAQVTLIDDPIVHRLSVNPQICLLCCLVITLRTRTLNPLVLVQLVNFQRLLISRIQMTYVTLK